MLDLSRIDFQSRESHWPALKQALELEAAHPRVKGLIQKTSSVAMIETILGESGLRVWDVLKTPARPFFVFSEQVVGPSSGVEVSVMGASGGHPLGQMEALLPARSEEAAPGAYFISEVTGREVFLDLLEKGFAWDVSFQLVWITLRPALGKKVDAYVSQLLSFKGLEADLPSGFPEGGRVRF